MWPKQVTFMLFNITIVFVLSFIPHLTLMVMQTVNPEFMDDLSPKSVALYKIFLRTFVINNMANQSSMDSATRNSSRHERTSYSRCSRVVGIDSGSMCGPLYARCSRVVGIDSGLMCGPLTHVVHVWLVLIVVQCADLLRTLFTCGWY